MESVMPLPPDFKVTSEMLWQGTLILALIDAGFVPLLAWRINPARFRQLKWALVATTAIFWSALWTWALANFWDSVHRYLFPDWARWLIPPVYGLLFAGVGLLFWWLTLRCSGNAVVGFCLLGGLWGMITHMWAVYLGIVAKPPMLQGVDPVAAVVVAVFEFMFYWCIILSVALLLQRGRQWLRALKQGQAHVP
jgi:hypothetical protein